MQEAMRQAYLAKDCDEVPVGAVITQHSRIIGSGFNQNIAMHSVTAHAEINAINEASNFIKNYRLIDCNMYVTLEPCHMCAKAIVDARIKNLYFATSEPKSGAIISIDSFLDKSFLNHKVSYKHGLMQKESSQLLKEFFISRRA